VSLVAREIEAAGIPTVIIGAAKDIVETVGVPRFVFSDVPLGNSMGLPSDATSQAEVLEYGFRLLETAIGPRTTVQTPVRWPGDGHSWKRDIMNLNSLTQEAIDKARADFEHQKTLAAVNR